MKRKAPPAASVESLLRAGLAAHQSGRLAEAEKFWRRALAQAPRHPEALHLCGLAAYFAGRHAEAAELIGKAIAADPHDPARFNNLGMALLGLGRRDEALSRFEQAIALRPDYVEAHANRGNALAMLRRLADAVQAFDRALALRPGHALAHNNRGNALAELDRIEEAAESYRRAAAAQPSLVLAHVGLAAALLRLGRAREALAASDRALALRPGLLEALLGRARALAALFRMPEALAAYDALLERQPEHVGALVGRAGVLHELGWLAPALASCDAAITLDPAHVGALLSRAMTLRLLRRHDAAREAWAKALALLDETLAATPNAAAALSNRASALLHLGRPEDALVSADRAAALRPGDAAMWSNRAPILEALDRDLEAAESYRLALALRPDDPGILFKRSTALHMLGDMRGAEVANDRVLALVPDHARARLHRALLLLLLGRLAEGFADYEARWATRELTATQPWFGPLPSAPPAPAAPNIVVPEPAAAPPLWHGDALNGRRLLLHAEQGFGDTLQFCRYVPLLAAREGAPVQVTLFVQPTLRPLFENFPGVFHVVREGDPYSAPDLRCPLLGLPQRFGTTLETIPPPVALSLDPVRRAQWRARLARRAGPRVGLVWSGNPAFDKDRTRSLSLAMLEPLSELPASFFSLQKKPRPGDAETLARCPWIEDLAAGLGDFGDTAAAIAELDLVISSDTAVAHLAGTLGAPTWVMLQFVPDWRWLLEREDCPWYPSIRLFRQTTPRDWAGVIGRVRAALAVWIDGAVAG